MLNVTMLQSYKVTKRKSATSCGEIADVEWLTSFCSERDGAVAHAARGSEGGQGSREETPIRSVCTDVSTAERVYSLQGHMRNNLGHGMNIVRQTDGTVRKVVIR